MKQRLRFLAMVAFAFTACDHAAISPLVKTAILAPAPPPTVHVIPFYNFGKLAHQPPGGTGSDSALIGDDAALYGSTLLGGDTKCSTGFDSGSHTGCGIVYRLVAKTGHKSYKLQVLHAFKGAPRDGAASFSTLMTSETGDLYGTTFYGGKYNEGTLFQLHPTSTDYTDYTETIVHNFGHGKDGAYPSSGVIEVNGQLYGTTIGGGTYTNQLLCGHSGGSPNGTCGTVYRVDPATGKERVLHNFGKSGDGASPWASLIDVSGTLYSTTYLGGTLSLCGTVFSIQPDGSGEQIVHNFLNNPTDGCDPLAALVAVNGTLYGTTCCGGGYYCSHCEGVIFSIDIASGKEQVLHKFGNSVDGSEPVAPLVNVKGVLYGTTTIGGGTDCQGGIGCGTIFSYKPSSNAVYKELYLFTGSADGSGPRAGLLYSQGAFYATTTQGGIHDFGTADQLRK